MLLGLRPGHLRALGSADTGDIVDLSATRSRQSAPGWGPSPRATPRTIPRGPEPLHAALPHPCVPRPAHLPAWHARSTSCPPASPAPSARWPPPPPGPVPSSPAHQVTPARPALRRRPAVSTCRPLDQPLEGTLGLTPPQSLLPGRTPEKAKEEEGTAPPPRQIETRPSESDEAS